MDSLEKAATRGTQPSSWRSQPRQRPGNQEKCMTMQAPVRRNVSRRKAFTCANSVLDQSPRTSSCASCFDPSTDMWCYIDMRQTKCNDEMTLATGSPHSASDATSSWDPSRGNEPWGGNFRPTPTGVNPSYEEPTQL